MPLKTSLAGMFAAAVIAAPAAVHADIYKWVDEQGVVTYGNVPPPGAKKLTQLAEDAGRVSTVPGLSREELARQRQLELEARLNRLERELYEERARNAMFVSGPPPFASYPVYSAGYAAYPGFYPRLGYPFASRAVFPRRAHVVVRHAPVRGMRR